MPLMANALKTHRKISSEDWYLKFDTIDTLPIRILYTVYIYVHYITLTLKYTQKTWRNFMQLLEVQSVQRKLPQKPPFCRNWLKLSNNLSWVLCIASIATWKPLCTTIYYHWLRPRARPVQMGQVVGRATYEDQGEKTHQHTLTYGKLLNRSILLDIELIFETFWNDLSYTTKICQTSWRSPHLSGSNHCQIY